MSKTGSKNKTGIIKNQHWLNPAQLEIKSEIFSELIIINFFPQKSSSILSKNNPVFNIYRGRRFIKAQN